MGDSNLKASTVILTIALWISGILTFAFNLLGFWELWHLAGWSTFFLSPIALILQFVYLFSSSSKGFGSFLTKIIALLTSVGFVWFTINISSTWFW